MRGIIVLRVVGFAGRIEVNVSKNVSYGYEYPPSFIDILVLSDDRPLSSETLLDLVHKLLSLRLASSTTNFGCR